MNGFMQCFYTGVRCFMAVVGFACSLGCALFVLGFIGAIIKGISAFFKGDDDDGE